MNKSVSEYFAELELEPPAVTDLRGLEAPEPMQEILLACTELMPGERYLAHLPHVPNPLFAHLASRLMNWQVFEEADGSALVLIWRVS